MKTNSSYIHHQSNLIQNSDSASTSSIESKESELTGLLQKSKKEKWPQTLLQVVLPFLFAGYGMVAAGVLLDAVQDWELFEKVKEVIVLVPALLGLKGNLEMTLASRLSTQVNLKLIHDKKTITRAVLGNFALTQLQSIVVGFFASFVTCVSVFGFQHRLKPSNLFILVGTSVGTASFASLLLGGIIMFIIIISARYGINPDNVATPIASSLGDLVTLTILAYFGTFLYIIRENFWIHIILISIFILSIPVFVYYCNKNEFVHETLYQGWMPVIVAMFISSIAGFNLEQAIKVYRSVAIYQPVVNGVGGNLVGIFASRLSTSLHKTSEMGNWAEWAPKHFFSYPFHTFFSRRNPEHKTALILQGLAIPGHIIFFFSLFYIQSIKSKIKLNFLLLFFYLLFSFAQVLILMIFCYYLVHLVWKWNKNPDNICIPLLTATGDFLGVTFLFLCFHLVYLIGNQSVKDQITSKIQYALNNTVQI